MRKYINGLSILYAICGAASLKANFTGIAVLTAGIGVKSSGVMHKIDDAGLRLANCAATPLVGRYGLANLILSAGLDANFVCAKNIVDWFGIGIVIGIGVSLDGNGPCLLSVPEFRMHEPFNARFGLTIKFLDTFMSLGIRGGYRQASIENGKEAQLMGPEKWTEASANSWGFGWFGQLVRPIPLEDDRWSVVLFSELHGDLQAADFKCKNKTTSGDYQNPQVGIKLGIGIGYCLFGDYD